MEVHTAHFIAARFHWAVRVLATIVVAMGISAGVADAGQAALTWKAPTTYEDGSTLTGIGGYRIHYGTSSGNYTQKVDVGNVTSYTVNGLTDGTPYYFAVMAYDTAGMESGLSNEMSKAAAAATYSITATAAAGGTIVAQGATGNQATNGSSTISTVTVPQGGSQTFTITPLAGYSIAGVTVDGVAKGAITTYTFSNVTASHTIGATFTAAASQPSTGSSIDLNVGGAAYTTSAGVSYKADAGFSGGRVGTTSAVIGGTTEGALYQNERYGNFSYSLPVANGTYNVTLKFAEIYWTAPGKRVFSVTVNGQTVISNLDIFATVGKNKAHDVTIPASVTGGVLTIGFVTHADNATVSAIRISPAGTTSPVAASPGTTTNPAGTVVYAGNTGGQQVTSAGITYAADSRFSGGNIGTTSAVIGGTTESALYQTERFGNFSYAIPVANGNYSVTLKFAEIYWTAPGRRIFSVAVNGTTMVNRLDLYATVGRNAAHDVTIPVTVTNGAINITFTSHADNATVGAILVKAR